MEAGRMTNALPPVVLCRLRPLGTYLGTLSHVLSCIACASLPDTYIVHSCANAALFYSTLLAYSSSAGGLR